MPKGIKYDDGKLRWDLLPHTATKEVVKVLTVGAKKYAPNNWQVVEGAQARYYAAAQRHLTDWKAGEKRDPETGLSHLAHAATCILFLMTIAGDVPVDPALPGEELDT